MALILVKFTLKDGATGGYIKIDRKGVKLTGSRGQTEVNDAKPYHTVTMWFEGAAGGTLEYELTENQASLVKGKVAISFGQTEGVVSGQFKLKSAA